MSDRRHETAEERDARRKGQRAAAEQRDRDYRHWLEHGSENLEDAWVSVCPYADSHDVTPYKLTEIVSRIRKGGPLLIETRWGTKVIYLDENQEEVRRLYQAGVNEAQMLNRLRVKRLLDEFGLSADPDQVEPVLVQPKDNEKLCYIAALVVDGQEHDVKAKVGNVVYHRPQDLGKAKADEAKKRTPGVTLAGLFLPQRNKSYLVRATGLYPLDFDGVENIQEVRDRITPDSHAALVFTSITGSGLRVCVWGTPARDADQYESFYKAIAQSKSKDWGLEAKLDKATFDCSRLCFLPYDPEITFAY